MKPLLALVGIFRNEAASIRSVIESARAAVDHFTLLDTGSSDETSGMIMGMAEGAHDFLSIGEIIPFAPFLSEHLVIDFGATRNRSLDLEAERSDAATFTLSLSGDEVL